MNNFTMNCYEMKRKSVNFSKIMSRGLSKPNKKFISDMIYGINASKDIKISNIARTLHEKIRLDNTIERLCIHLETFKENEKVNDNYYNFVRNMINEYPIAIFDDSDITKIYGKKFEDIDIIKDGSDENKKYKPGYQMCNAVVLTRNKKQPIPIYSKVFIKKQRF